MRAPWRSMGWFSSACAIVCAAALAPSCGGSAPSIPNPSANAREAPRVVDCEVLRLSPASPVETTNPSVVLLLPILPSGEGHAFVSGDGRLRALRGFVLPAGKPRILVFDERGLVAVTDTLADYPELRARGELIDGEELGGHALCYEPAVREPGRLDPDETPEGQEIAVAPDGARSARLVLPDEVLLTDSRRKDPPRSVSIGAHLSTPSLAFAGERVVVVVGPTEFALIDWASGRVRNVKSGTQDAVDWTSSTITTAEGDAACAFLRFSLDSICAYTPFADITHARFLRPRPGEHLLCFRAPGGAARLVRLPRVGAEGVARADRTLLEGNTNHYTREKLSALSPDGETVAVIEALLVGGDDDPHYENARLLVFERNGKKPVAGIDLPGKSATIQVTQLDFSADGRHLLLSWDRVLGVLRLDTKDWWTLPVPRVAEASFELEGRFARMGQRHLDLEAREFVWLGVPPVPTESPAVTSLGAGRRVVPWHPERGAVTIMAGDGSAPVSVAPLGSGSAIAFLPNGDVELVGVPPNGVGPNVACVASNGKALPIDACRSRFVDGALACALGSGD